MNVAETTTQKNLSFVFKRFFKQKVVTVKRFHLVTLKHQKIENKLLKTRIQVKQNNDNGRISSQIQSKKIIKFFQRIILLCNHNKY